MPAPVPDEPVDLRTLIGHRESVAAATPLEEVHRRLAKTGRDFLAVLEGPRFLGLCARREIAMQLGARFGFALFARQPASERLMAQPLHLTTGEPITEALGRISARPEEHFYDDVVLVEPAGNFLGFIFVHSLVRLQTRMMLGQVGALERSQREIEEKNHAMEDDLRMARDVQMAMLPSALATPGGESWRFHSQYVPAAGVSGDFFQLVRLSDTRAALLVCDVMGHGVRSALVTAMLRAFVEDRRETSANPGAFLTHLNHGLMGVLRQGSQLIFVTAACAVLDTAAGLVLYAQAGHPTGFLRRATGAVDLLPADDAVAGPALGLIDGAEYMTGQAAVFPGDTVVLFTDGLVEARAASGEEWGEQRLRRLLEAQAAAPSAELLPLLVEAALGFAQGKSFDDDVCLAALDWSR